MENKIVLRKTKQKTLYQITVACER